jgi:hypothetical protein
MKPSDLSAKDSRQEEMKREREVICACVWCSPGLDALGEDLAVEELVGEVAQWRAYLTLPKFASPRVRPTSYLPSSDEHMHSASASPPFTIHNLKLTPLLIGNGLSHWRDTILVGTDEEREMEEVRVLYTPRSILLCYTLGCGVVLFCLLLPLFIVSLPPPHPSPPRRFRNKLLTHTQINTMPPSIEE